MMMRSPLIGLLAIALAACGELEVDRNNGGTTDPTEELPGGDDTGTPVDSDDQDGDGSPATTVEDCDDTDSDVYPGAPELCDGKDNDCDGVIDDGLVQYEYFLDADADTFGSNAAQSVWSCQEETPAGYSNVDGDCNDADPETFPGAEDPTGDGIDQNCDDGIDNGETGSTDPDPGTPYEDPVDSDLDGDGSTDDVDCADEDPEVYPGATEVCGDGLDNDCSGGDASCESPDTDGDGSTDDVDCADEDPEVYPGATEELDDEDNDCDGEIDELWQAYVLATYGSTGYYNLNVQSYNDSDELGDPWQESATESSGTQVEVEFLTSEYDLSSSCGLRLNVSEGNPASDWLCAGGVIDSSVRIDIWFDGELYDESDLEVWDAGGGSCSAVLVVSSDSDCQV